MCLSHVRYRRKQLEVDTFITGQDVTVLEAQCQFVSSLSRSYRNSYYIVYHNNKPISRFPFLPCHPKVLGEVVGFARNNIGTKVSLRHDNLSRGWLQRYYFGSGNKGHGNSRNGNFHVETKSTRWLLPLPQIKWKSYIVQKINPFTHQKAIIVQWSHSHSSIGLTEIFLRYSKVFYTLHRFSIWCTLSCHTLETLVTLRLVWFKNCILYRSRISGEIHFLHQIGCPLTLYLPLSRLKIWNLSVFCDSRRSCLRSEDFNISRIDDACWMHANKIYCSGWTPESPFTAISSHNSSKHTILLAIEMFETPWINSGRILCGVRLLCELFLVCSVETSNLLASDSGGKLKLIQAEDILRRIRRRDGGETNEIFAQQTGNSKCFVMQALPINLSVVPSIVMFSENHSFFFTPDDGWIFDGWIFSNERFDGWIFFEVDFGLIGRFDGWIFDGWIFCFRRFDGWIKWKIHPSHRKKKKHAENHPRSFSSKELRPKCWMFDKRRKETCGREDQFPISHDHIQQK